MAYINISDLHERINEYCKIHSKWSSEKQDIVSRFYTNCLQIVFRLCGKFINVKIRDVQFNSERGSLIIDGETTVFQIKFHKFSEFEDIWRSASGMSHLLKCFSYYASLNFKKELEKHKTRYESDMEHFVNSTLRRERRAPIYEKKLKPILRHPKSFITRNDDILLDKSDSPRSYDRSHERSHERSYERRK
jgi:hypothetical protein